MPGSAFSLLSPFAISRQNSRSTSRRCVGCPGDFIGALPVNSIIHPAGLPISTTSTITMLRAPVEPSHYVWVGPKDAPSWMRNGTYLVARRIRILFDVWDANTLAEQERTIGRHKLTGAPLGHAHENDPVPLAAETNGEPLIPSDAHIRLAAPQTNDAQRILRRGYSFADPIEPGSGQLDAGLFFICFQRDPRKQFIPIQRRLAEHDALSKSLMHTASSVFAIPPGARHQGFVGETLFQA